MISAHYRPPKKSAYSSNPFAFLAAVRQGGKSGWPGRNRRRAAWAFEPSHNHIDCLERVLSDLMSRIVNMGTQPTG
jgi:hypothetical protein